MVALKSQMERPDASSAKWQESLLRSKAQIEKGNTVPLLPVLEELRTAAEQLESEQGVNADGNPVSADR